jgi:hypothetical protein
VGIALRIATMCYYSSSLLIVLSPRSYDEARGHDQPSPNRDGVNLDLEGVVIVFTRFNMRVAGAAASQMRNQYTFKSVIGWFI